MVEFRIISFLVALAALNKVVQADKVTVASTCLGSSEAIEVSFRANDSNFGLNWIGIYPASEIGNVQRLPPGAMWVWLCGSQRCRPNTNPRTGTVTFQGSSDHWLQGWPLQPGRYQAVLSRGHNNEIWPVLATSEVFEVGCNSNPSPTPGGNSGSRSGPSSSSAMMSTIMSATSDIKSLYASDSLLVGACLRLVFHDCLGGCDGEYTQHGCVIRTVVHLISIVPLKHGRLR